MDHTMHCTHFVYHHYYFYHCSGENYQERRKQIIQESKYLGGDMEHTHLVKGLDYALLDKVNNIILYIFGINGL